MADSGSSSFITGYEEGGMAITKGKRGPSKVRVQTGRSRPLAKTAGPATTRVHERVSHRSWPLLGSDFSNTTFEGHAALLGNSRLSHPMYAGERATIFQQL